MQQLTARRRPTLRACLFLGLSLMLTSVAQASPHFPTSPAIENQIDFWERIFNDYTSAHIVLHDRTEPHIILGSVHLPSRGVANTQAPGLSKLSQREEQLYTDVLEDFASDGEAAKRRSALHRQVWKAYSQDKSGLKRLLTGQASVRSQGGLADTFKKALHTSKLYLPRMERIFREENLPPELTRLVFVESMFNIRARSKVGASGLWQLMPGAARPYIRVNRKVDERNSPFLATKAAARIMAQNYRALGSWPLAITAYNHGLGGMRRAINRTGSRELHAIIANFEADSFGFASQNFYAEFVAAMRTHEKLSRSKNSTKLATDDNSPGPRTH